MLIRATGFATVVAVYEWSAGRLADHAAGRLHDERGRRRPARSTSRAGRSYTIQVGGAGGVGGAADAEGRLLPGHATATASYDALDKCPTVAGHRALRRLPAGAARRARASASTSTGSGIRITRLVVDRVPKGAKVVARCGGCGSQTVRAKRTGTVALTGWCGKSVAAAGHVEIRVTMGRSAPARTASGRPAASSSGRCGAMGSAAQTALHRRGTAPSSRRASRRSPWRCSPRWRSRRRRRRSSSHPRR